MIRSLSIAKRIAQESFAGKVDEAGEPYINHLARVADNFNDDDTLATIAWLHDILEDTGWKMSELRDMFSDRVCDALYALTKLDGEPYTEYIERVKLNADAVKVKLADLRDNMDLTRLKVAMDDYRIMRMIKYHNAYLMLTR